MQVAVLVLLLPLVTCHDVAIGLNSYGTKIYDENKQASPAIWRQTENVTIVASDNEVISKVLVIDMRPGKDGDAKIVDGGEKQKNVTIELKSPTVFRGYDFHIEVYAVPEAQSSNRDQQAGTSSDNTNMTKNDSMSTPSSSISDVTIEQSTRETTSADIIRNVRNSNMDISKKSNHTEIKSIEANLDNETGYIIDEDTSLSTTPHDITSTDLPETTENNVPDFPITGMEGDEKRHVRKIGDDLYTSTAKTIINQNEGTTESYSSDSKNETVPESGSEVNNTSLDLGEKGETDTTASDIITTTLSDESVTISPDRNGKDILDFDDLLSTDGEESRFARHINAEMVSTTNSEIATTEDVPTTPITPNIFTDFNNETRNQHDAVYDTLDDTTATTSEPQVNTEGDKLPPLFKIIIKSGAYDMSNQANESTGDFNSTDNVGDDTTITPDILATTVSGTESNENSTEDQLRKVRGINEENETLNPAQNVGSAPNYPVFVDPSNNKPNVDEDYVYVPILAVISKHNYPVFRGVLDNIAMNVAFPGLDANTASVISKDSDETSDDKTNRIISFT